MEIYKSNGSYETFNNCIPYYDKLNKMIEERNNLQNKLIELTNKLYTKDLGNELSKNKQNELLNEIEKISNKLNDLSKKINGSNDNKLNSNKINGSNDNKLNSNKINGSNDNKLNKINDDINKYNKLINETYEYLIYLDNYLEKFTKKQTGELKQIIEEIKNRTSTLKLVINEIIKKIDESDNIDEKVKLKQLLKTLRYQIKALDTLKHEFIRLYDNMTKCGIRTSQNVFYNLY
jgi:hypothetical protein